MKTTIKGKAVSIKTMINSIYSSEYQEWYIVVYEKYYWIIIFILMCMHTALDAKNDWSPIAWICLSSLWAVPGSHD